MSKPNKHPQKIGAGEKCAYLLANIGNIPLMTLLSTFFLIFYTDVVGLEAGALATLFLIARIVDGVSDPIMGFLLDKFPVRKMGKFRPMLILGTVICVINYILLWFGAIWSPVAKYGIVYATYLLIGWTFDIMDISLNSLLPVMTADNQERNSLSLLKVIGYAVGSMAISIGGPLIVASGTLESYYVLIFGAMAVTLVFSIAGALGVKERVAFSGDAQEKYGLRDLLRFLTAKPVLVSFLATVMYIISTQIRSGANAYYFTYVIGDLEQMSGISGASVIGMFPGMILAPLLASKFGKKAVYTAGLMVAAIGPAICIFAPKSLGVLYAGNILFSFGSGVSTPLMYGVQADNTMYIQYTTGKRAEAAIASLNSFITKIGQGVAGAIPGYILAAVGFVGGAAVQPDGVDAGLIACVSGIPAVLCLLSALIFGLGYHLSKQEVDHMAAALQEQEGQTC